MKKIYEQVSREEFLEVYNKNQPNKWTIFTFKYFAKSTRKSDLWLSRIIELFLIMWFMIGFINVIINDNLITHWLVISVITLIIVGLGILMGSAAIMNNRRIKRICKKLGINRQEYEVLTNLYIL